MSIRVVSTPEPRKSRPGKPPRWRTFRLPVGSEVEYRGLLWEKVLRSAGDWQYVDWELTMKSDGVAVSDPQRRNGE